MTIDADALMYQAAVQYAVDLLRAGHKQQDVETRVMEHFETLTRKEAVAIRQSADHVIQHEIILKPA